MSSRKQLIEKWKTDYDFKTLVSASVSLAVTVLFAFYNGFLGIYHASLWHGTVCVYYIVLIILRGILIATEMNADSGSGHESIIKRVYLRTSFLLLLLNMTLVVPITLMIKMQKPVSLTLIPAITTAVYTFYKVALASINLKKSRNASNSLLRLLRTISFIDALVSVLTLQNTLIMISSKGENMGILPFTIVTSTMIWLAVFILSIAAAVKGIISLRSRQ